MGNSVQYRDVRSISVVASADHSAGVSIDESQCFVLAHIRQVFGHKKFTAATSVLFTISPAVPFFAVAYSESYVP